MGGTQGGAFFLDQDKPNHWRKVKIWRPRRKESAAEQSDILFGAEKVGNVAQPDHIELVTAILYRP